MTFNELVREVSEKAELNQNVTKNVLSTTIEVIQSQIAQGNPVLLSSLGRLLPKEVKPRMGVNPSTGERIKIAGYKTAAYKPSLEFKSSLNK